MSPFSGQERWVTSVLQEIEDRGRNSRKNGHLVRSLSHLGEAGTSLLHSLQPDNSLLVWVQNNAILGQG
jgi:hypothetical protein